MGNRFEDWVARQRCFLCTRAASVTFSSDYAIQCARCGAYQFERYLTRTMEDDDIKLLPYLSIHTREASDSGEPVRLDTANWKEIALAAKAIPFSVKVKKFLAVAAARSRPGQRANFDLNTDIPLVYALDRAEFGALFQDLFQRDYVANGTLDGGFVLTGKAWQSLESQEAPQVADHHPTGDHFVNAKRIEELKAVKTTAFDLGKLIRTCEELNICFERECYLAVTMLVRSVLDHVPPIFGYDSFAQVVSNYGGGKAFKDSMTHLQNSSRAIADRHLHQHIRGSESLPNETQVNFANDLDVLLGEIVRILK